MLNRQVFFGIVRGKLFAGFLSQSQVDGINQILDEWVRRGLTDLRHLAYMLATVHHETGAKFQPIREGGGEAYLRAKPYYPWVGMGLVQVTWETNARKFGAAKPEDLLSWPVALSAVFDGMIKGMFTGKKLGDYFSATSDDPLNARRIINGIDRAAVIQSYHDVFLLALKTGAAASSTVAIDLPTHPPAPLKPVVAPPHHLPAPAAPQGFWSRFWAALTGKMPT